MAFQDDERENKMRNLFSLYKNENEGRDGIDAHLDIDGVSIPFELKTTSTGHVTTVRDFGPDHIIKWKDKHWLIGFHNEHEEYYVYATPEMMSGWINEKEKYISYDFKIADILSKNMTLEDMNNILEEKNIYSINDAKKIHKKQYTIEKYKSLQDLENGYSPEQMLSIFRDRAKYLIERGSTLNNPHIPENYFKGFKRITENHAEVLKDMVREYLKKDN
ncbi:hypothetical protein SH16_03663 [Aeromonas caviae]|uniref:hypothetical protein n=1 Tax=Aeromonas caviae TaxID=648 RepID=UPI0006518F36|nr:hypothetical protein [Aeromonas caviae]KLV38132.1 hypothetical protein SH16_03663 [Aeromonas caviae]MBL0656799.1 hypothetical protein [Aeromonas caviae]MDH0140356.1 hypothetical protein [Aeromonas caviae]MDX7784152.1 hypothetical protein [Aeromonas caviae]MDX7891419.1 hypothetical protein [Aeromonas caviae]